MGAIAVALVATAVSFAILWYWHHAIGLSTFWRKGIVELLVTSVTIAFVAFYLYCRRTVNPGTGIASGLKEHLSSMVLVYSLVILLPVAVAWQWPPEKSQFHLLAGVIILFITSIVALFVHLAYSLRKSTYQPGQD